MKDERTTYRRNHIIVLFIIGTFVLIAKAASIQLFNDSYKSAARNRTLNKRIIHPARGLMYDRNGKLMVVNQPAYDLKVIYKQVDPEMDTTHFCSLLGISKETFKSRLDKNFRSSRYSKSVPYTFMSNLRPKEFTKFQEFLYKFPGFYPELRNVRAYPYKNTAHALGYISEVSKNVIEKSNGLYQSGDYIGVSGLERTYEDLLRGTKGLKLVLKDNLGRDVGAYEDGKLDVKPKQGNDLISTIDVDLQAYGEKLMQNKLGSIVAIEPKTGEVLAMVSSKTYDPNELSMHKNRGKAFQTLLGDTLNRPFLDRSVMAKYPPGSILKPILSLIALEEGITYPDRTIYCSGSYMVNSKGFSQGCHSHPTPYNVQTAIAYSCNSYFYQLFRELIESKGYKNPGEGLSIFNNYLGQFGLGKQLGVDISHENAGNIPTPEYYDRQYDYVPSGWRSTYILSLGIGQGELQLTTLQMANLAAVMANRGYWRTPHLIKGLMEQEESNAFQPNNELHQVNIDRSYYGPVIEGMERVVLNGTARNAYIPDISICGKTGTSQNPHGKDHSVFFAFAPKEDPKIAIAVFVENAGWGSDFGAPIASLMIEQYIRKSILPKRKWIEDRMLNLVVEPEN